MRTVISYDVSDDKQRTILAKVLAEHAGTRVQKSVFEAPELPRAGYLHLRSHAERLLDPRTDSIRYYLLCGSCIERIEHYGKGPGLLDIPEPFRIL